MTPEQIDEIIKLVKDDPKYPKDIEEKQLKKLVEKMGLRILHFCRRKDIPEELYYTWVEMVVELANQHKSISFEQEGTFVSSITEGDTTVGFSQYSSSSAKESSLIETIVLNYKIDLMRYRKLSGLQ